MVSQAHISAFILAGGKSSRMGTDKGMLFLNGKPMIWHIAEALKPVVDSVTLITNNTDYAELGLPMLPDDIPNQGPLGGIATALCHTKTENNLIVSCDMPMLTTKATRWFLSNCAPTAINLATIGQQWQPLLGLYNAGCLPRFAEFIAKDKLALHIAIKQMNYHLVPMDGYADAFVNINTKADFEQLKLKYNAR